MRRALGPPSGTLSWRFSSWTVPASPRLGPLSSLLQSLHGFQLHQEQTQPSHYRPTGPVSLASSAPIAASCSRLSCRTSPGLVRTAHVPTGPAPWLFPLPAALSPAPAPQPPHGCLPDVGWGLGRWENSSEEPLLKCQSSEKFPQPASPQPTWRLPSLHHHLNAVCPCAHSFLVLSFPVTIGFTPAGSSSRLPIVASALRQSKTLDA